MACRETEVGGISPYGNRSGPGQLMTMLVGETRKAWAGGANFHSAATAGPPGPANRNSGPSPCRAAYPWACRGCQSVLTATRCVSALSAHCRAWLSKSRDRMPQRAEDNERVLTFRRLPVVLLVVLLAAGERGDFQRRRVIARREMVSRTGARSEEVFANEARNRPERRRSRPVCRSRGRCSGLLAVGGGVEFLASRANLVDEL